MNKVEATEQGPPLGTLTPGSIWQRKDKGDFFSLQRISDRYLLACLDDGEPYSDWKSEAGMLSIIIHRFTRIHGTVTITPEP